MGYFDRLLSMSVAAEPARAPVVEPPPAPREGAAAGTDPAIAVRSDPAPTSPAGGAVGYPLARDSVRSPATDSIEPPAAPAGRAVSAEPPAIRTDRQAEGLRVWSHDIAASDRSSLVSGHFEETVGDAGVEDRRIVARDPEPRVAVPAREPAVVRKPAPPAARPAGDALRPAALHAAIETARRWVSSPPRSVPATPDTSVERALPSTCASAEPASFLPTAIGVPVEPRTSIMRPVFGPAVSSEAVRPTFTEAREEVSLSIGSIQVTIEGSQKPERRATGVQRRSQRSREGDAERGRHLHWRRYYLRS